MAKEIEAIHRDPCGVVITAERYSIANKIASEAQEIVIPKKSIFF
ncbi:MAG: hypothetical protein QMD21_03700 [Candidatus Thermoplasmatota archaeon]|nr:hypothetical protein [Candidatus Thermoplasmatota archaeon]